MKVPKIELLIFNGSILLFCLIAFYFTNQLSEAAANMDVGPAFFPKIIIWVIFVMNILFVVNQLFILKKDKSNENNKEDKQSIKRFLIIITLLIVYIFSWEFIDYKISTFLLLISTMFLLSVRDWKKLLIISVGFVLIIYVLFEIILQVSMP